MANQKVNSASEWLKKIGVGVIQGVAISVVTEKIAPGAKRFVGNVLDKMAIVQGRKDLAEADDLVRRSEDAAPPVVTPPATTPPASTTKNPPVVPPVSSKSGTDIIDALFVK